MSDTSSLMAAVKQGDLGRLETALDSQPDLVNQRDAAGASALHYAALGGDRAIVRLLVDRGADVNLADLEFGATPTGWAIEYLRELGGFLSIELEDLAYAIQIGDVRWVARLLERFPRLRDQCDSSGKSFRQLARESDSAEIEKLMGSDNSD